MLTLHKNLNIMKEESAPFDSWSFLFCAKSPLFLRGMLLWFWENVRARERRKKLITTQSSFGGWKNVHIFYSNNNLSKNTRERERNLITHTHFHTDGECIHTASSNHVSFAVVKTRTSVVFSVISFVFIKCFFKYFFFFVLWNSTERTILLWRDVDSREDFFLFAKKENRTKCGRRFLVFTFTLHPCQRITVCVPRIMRNW